MAVTDVSTGRGSLDLQEAAGRIWGQRDGASLDMFDFFTEVRTLLLSHSHADSSTGGQLDWDNIFSDAVHSHGSNAEGGTLTGSTALVANSVTGTQVSEAMSRHSHGVYIGDIAATSTIPIFHAPSTVTIQEVTVGVIDTIEVSNTDYWQFQIANMTSSTDLLSLATDTIGVAITEDVARALGPDQNLTLSTDDVLELQITKAASADQLDCLYIQVRYAVTL